MTFAERLLTAVEEHIPSEHKVGGGSMTGHSGGNMVEALCEGFLKDMGAVTTHLFLQAKVMELWESGEFPTAAALMAFLRRQWWWKLNSRKAEVVAAAVTGTAAIPYKQDDTCDLVMVEEGRVHLINVKSHDVGRKSRPPNIVSLNKVLKFFDWVTDLPSAERAKTLDEAEIYFLSVSWKQTGDTLELRAAHVKRLTKLNVQKIPKLNFDAALQIQWQVESMVEVPDQTPLEFARDLANRTMRDFQVHVTRKTQNFTRLAEKLGT